MERYRALSKITVVIVDVKKTFKEGTEFVVVQSDKNRVQLAFGKQLKSWCLKDILDSAEQIFTKWCRGCKERKEVDNFYPSATNFDGIEHQCKTCRKVTKKTVRTKKIPKQDTSFVNSFLSMPVRR